MEGPNVQKPPSALSKTSSTVSRDDDSLPQNVQNYLKQTQLEPTINAIVN